MTPNSSPADPAWPTGIAEEDRSFGTGSAALWQRERGSRGHLSRHVDFGSPSMGVVAHPIVLSWCLYMFLVAAGRFTLACLDLSRGMVNESLGERLRYLPLR